MWFVVGFVGLSIYLILTLMRKLDRAQRQHTQDRREKLWKVWFSEKDKK